MSVFALPDLWANSALRTDISPGLALDIVECSLPETVPLAWASVGEIEECNHQDVEATWSLESFQSPGNDEQQEDVAIWICAQDVGQKDTVRTTEDFYGVKPEDWPTPLDTPNTFALNATVSSPRSQAKKTDSR